jgi:hypothetical protein
VILVLPRRVAGKSLLAFAVNRFLQDGMANEEMLHLGARLSIT